MQSKGDPILDAQALCEAEPRTLEQLTTELEKLGWNSELVQSVIQMATGIYIKKQGDLFVGRNGTVTEIINKVLKNET